MTDNTSSISNKPRFILKVAVTLLIITAAYCLLPISAAMSASDAGTPLISLTNFEYRFGNPPDNTNGVPLWAAGEDSGDWMPYQVGTSLVVPREDEYVWFRVTIPEHRLHGSVLRFYDMGNSMDIYLDGQSIYSNHYLEQPGIRRIYEYFYTYHADLPDDSSGKNIYIKAKPKKHVNKSNSYILYDFDLTSQEKQMSDMINTGLMNLILGSILTAAGAMFFLLPLFARINVKTMMSFGLLSITSGITTLYQSYFKYIVGVPTLLYYVSYMANTLMPVGVCQLFKQFIHEKHKKIADIFSGIFIAYSVIMLILDLTGICWAFTPMPIFFAFFALSALSLSVLMMKNKDNSRTETRIVIIGSTAYGLTGIYDIVFVILIKGGEGIQYHIWGLIIMLVSLVFSMMYRYNEAHKKIVVYSKELEEKNKNLNDAWSEVKTAHDNIAELNLSLEQKVIERTEQLNVANADLTEANEELTAMNEQLMATMDALTEAQAQLIQTEKIAALGKLVAGVAHELNTPVAAISSNIQFEEAIFKAVDLTDNSSMNSYFTSISPLRDINKEAGKRITEIVRNLTNFSRLDESDLKEVDLTEGLESAVTILGEQLGSKQISIKREFTYIPKITCYPRLINQVFMDILENAIDSLGTGGTITISTSCSASKIFISIRDNGQGIPENELQYLFDPRLTNKGERVGIGLGLPLSYRIIEKHDGRITVNSTPGEGSEFVIELPCDLQAG